MHGFEANFSTEAKVPTWDPLLRPEGEKSSQWWHAIEGNAAAESYGTAYWSMGEKVHEALRGDDSALIVDRALAFMQSSAEAKMPFFSVIWFHSPHLPVVGGPEWMRRYQDQDDLYRRSYGATVSALDAAVGRVRTSLSEWGIDRQTLIVFCSDNGPEGNASAPGSTAGLRGRKRSLYEGGIRVPGIVVWPAQIEPGSVSNRPVVTSDLLPTICEITGRDAPSNLDGVSMASLWSESAAERQESICFESANQMAVIGERFKLYGLHARENREANGEGGRVNRSNIPTRNRPTPDVERFELYDLVNDPNETTNLADQHPDIVRSLYAELDAWRTSCRASRRERGIDP